MGRNGYAAANGNGHGSNGHANAYAYLAERLRAFGVRVGRTEDCWESRLPLHRGASVRFHVGGKWVSAPRYAFALLHGYVPDRRLYRVCLSRRCVNPLHCSLLRPRTRVAQHRDTRWRLRHDHAKGVPLCALAVTRGWSLATVERLIGEGPR